MVDNYKEKKDTLYLYNKESKKWIDVDLPIETDNYNQKIFYHSIFKHNDRFFLLRANHYNEKITEVSVYAFYSHYSEELLHCKVNTPHHFYPDANAIMKNDIKIEKPRYFFIKDDNSNKIEPNGLVTCDFYDGRELFTVKILKNIGDSIFIKILDSKKKYINRDT